MKAIINGLRYDTETAELLAYLPCSYFRNDFKAHETAIYRTRNGRYFLAGAGGPLSLWGQPNGNNGRTGGDLYSLPPPGIGFMFSAEGIRALTNAEARDYLETCGTGGLAAIEKYFPVEDA